MSEAITPEQVAEFQRQQAVKEQEAMRQLINDLQALAAERGFVIVAIPRLTSDGRTVADWGLNKRA